jgi:hypothetical protein
MIQKVGRLPEISRAIAVLGCQHKVCSENGVLFVCPEFKIKKAEHGSVVSKSSDDDKCFTFRTANYSSPYKRFDSTETTRRWNTDRLAQPSSIL